MAMAASSPWPSSSLLAAGANGAAPTMIIAACHRHTIIDFRFEEVCCACAAVSLQACLLTAYIVQYAHPHSHPHSLTDTSCKTRSTPHCPLHTLSAARHSLYASRRLLPPALRTCPLRVTASNVPPSRNALTSHDLPPACSIDEHTDPEEMTSLQAGETDDSYIHWQQQCPKKVFLQEEVAPFHPGADLATQLARWGRLWHDRNRARFYAAEIVEGVEGLLYAAREGR
ncbi:hypothetical protein GGX14DRAFT_667723 [Mycena pura]|uniref:Uncharacterized protein n=1 Tax=Mycena pura TaxID=153505 RepID=A0AAD6UYN5_9AGAR|nr:hypothetical protein GGX14DRAFT_667723 [Mycena pura]